MTHHQAFVPLVAPGPQNEHLVIVYNSHSSFQRRQQGSAAVLWLVGVGSPYHAEGVSREASRGLGVSTPYPKP